MPVATHETIVGALGISATPVVPASPSCSIKTRAEAWLIEGEVGPTRAMLILTMGQEREGENITGGARFREYDVLATFIWYPGFALESGIATAKAYRELVKKRWEPDYTATPGSILAGVSAVWDVEAVDLPPQEEDKYAAGYEVERLGVTVFTNETTHG